MGQGAYKFEMSLGELCSASSSALVAASEAIAGIADALSVIVRAACEVINKRLLPWSGKLFDGMLRCVATKKEFWLMHHAKRRRTRKKYRARLMRRLLASLRPDGEVGDE